jgi:hypothetical protein
MKPFHVTDYLRDIDQEMMAHRQEIAKHQVRLQQLSDMRVLMMSREEDRAAMNGHGSPFGTLPNGAEIAVRDPLTYQPQASALLAPGQSVSAPADLGRPKLTDEERAERRLAQAPARRDYQREYRNRMSHEAKLRRRLEVAKEYGATGLSMDERLDTARKVRSDKGVPNPARGTRRAKVGRHRMYADEVLALFNNYRSTPLTARQVIDAIFPGRVPDKAEKQAVYQCLFDLKSNGVITQVAQGHPYELARPPDAPAQT